MEGEGRREVRLRNLEEAGTRIESAEELELEMRLALLMWRGEGGG